MELKRKTDELPEFPDLFFKSLMEQEYYGLIEFHFMKGHVVRIKKTESYEPEAFNKLIAG